jgi:hypothetical protein
MPRKNPFFAHADVELLLAWRNGEVAGRVAAIDDRSHLAAHRDNVAMFGFFEAEDGEASRALLAAVEAWAVRRGRCGLRGPLNPSLNESAGVLVDGFDTDPMVMTPHNPREYAAFLESAGYSKAKDLFAWIYDIQAGVPPAVARLAERARKRAGITVRPLNVADFAREVERLRGIYSDAWAQNWGFVAPSVDEFRRLAAELKPIFDPRCAICAEHDGRIVGCAVALPDINQALKGTDGRLLPFGIVRLLRRRHYIDQARLLLFGVAAEFRTLGLYPLLIVELYRQLAGGPYRRIEFSWVLEDNVNINRPAEQAGARRYKTFRIYDKALS